jgi:hypothetical protein
MSRVSKTALGAATAGLCLFATATPALVGLNVVHAGETIGQLGMTIEMA